MEKDNNVRNGQLQEYAEKRTPVKIIMKNGFQMIGMLVKSFDDSVIKVEGDNGKEKLVYHDAISTVEPLHFGYQHYTDAEWVRGGNSESNGINVGTSTRNTRGFLPVGSRA
ncbi:MAG: RNA chaperone Hfq [Abditibacteriota bacterium]|nr:RNA chaperone Hfq [Abditibacteriota bacterium]